MKKSDKFNLEAWMEEERRLIEIEISSWAEKDRDDREDRMAGEEENFEEESYQE